MVARNVDDDPPCRSWFDQPASLNVQTLRGLRTICHHVSMAPSFSSPTSCQNTRPPRKLKKPHVFFCKCLLIERIVCRTSATVNRDCHFRHSFTRRPAKWHLSDAHSLDDLNTPPPLWADMRARSSVHQKLSLPDLCVSQTSKP